MISDLIPTFIFRPYVMSDPFSYQRCIDGVFEGEARVAILGAVAASPWVSRGDG